MRKVIALIKHDFTIEIRNQYSFFGVVLYVAATTFLLFMTVKNPEQKVWAGLYWIILLFASVNAVAKSFLQVSKGRMLYYYTVVNAITFITAKVIYNSFLMLAIALFNFFLVQLFLGNPVQNTAFFIGNTVLGALCFANLFTLLSSLAAKANQNAALVAILGFPLVIPMLVVVNRITTASLAVNLSNLPYIDLSILGGYFVLLFILNLILYPFLWRE